jgi:tRNA/rRNA methyltransferase
MKIIIVLVKPEYQVNLGSVARVMKNFECEDLRIVKGIKPGRQALKFSMKGKEILEKAKRFNTLEKAVKDCDLVIGTTSNPARFSKNLKPSISIKQIPKTKKLALVFGSEGNGLSKSDALKCDLTAYIPLNPQYPVLNLSHAVAIFLYQLKKFKTHKTLKCDRKKIKKLVTYFSKSIEKGKFKKKSKIIKAFSNILFKSNPSENEVQALFAAFKFTSDCKPKQPNKQL